jgi:hypothetical protein
MTLAVIGTPRSPHQMGNGNGNGSVVVLEEALVVVDEDVVGTGTRSGPVVELLLVAVGVDEEVAVLAGDVAPAPPLEAGNASPSEPIAEPLEGFSEPLWAPTEPLPKPGVATCVGAAESVPPGRPGPGAALVALEGSVGSWQPAKARAATKARVRGHITRVLRRCRFLR